MFPRKYEPLLRNEKSDLEASSAAHHDLRKCWQCVARLVLCLSFSFYLLKTICAVTYGEFIRGHHKHGHDFSADCPQTAPLYPANSTSAFDQITEYVSGPYVNYSIGYLSQAVTYPTVSFDDLDKVPVDEEDSEGDQRWSTRFAFIQFLETTFPLLHSKLTLEKVNTFGLFYTWQGSDASLKPTLLMGHTDVVPVPDETVGQWTHPPFSGLFDGEYIWGRGASDDKSQTIAILEAVTILLEQGFEPTRTVLLSFGFDEEISGGQGAGSLAPFIHERYGDEGIEVIVDEGNGFVHQWGTFFASPGVSEKGHINVEITVRMPGGHSSVPSDHTAIGVSAELITMIESPEHKYEPKLDEQNPYLGHLRCGAAYAPEFPSKWAKLLSSTKTIAKLAKDVASESIFVKYLMTTSVAVDTIRGGVKVNALPEEVKTVINHRINIGSSSSAVKDNIRKLAKKMSTKYGLALVDFDEADEGRGSSITLKANNVLEPAPLTPTSSMPFSVLSGTTRALYGTDIILSPGLMTGNTDTRYYWSLTKNIFRFSPARGRGKDAGMGNIHTVNERMSIEGHLDALKWMWGFIRNMDEASHETSIAKLPVEVEPPYIPPFPFPVISLSLLDSQDLSTLESSAIATHESRNKCREEKMSTVTFDTTMGKIEFELYTTEAPLTCKNFHTLASRGYYDGLIFHRVIKEFMIQGGDPTGTGRGGSSIYGAKFNDEISWLKHTGAGILSMANSGPNTNGSQFFITLAPTPWLDGKHTVFGRVKTGMQVVERMGLVATDSGDRPIQPLSIRTAKAE